MVEHKAGASASSLQGQDSPTASSSGKDMDCTIVVDQDGSTHPAGMKVSSSAASFAQHQQEQKLAPAAGKDCDAQADPTTAALPAATPPQAAGTSPAAGPAAPSRPRTYYIDWLRTFLTVLVVVHHCVVAYQSSYAWAAKRGDTALFLFSELFVVGNQAYFMTLFFFLSGLYVPGSYRRKGAGKFLLDRTLRLVVPCIFYSFLAPPFILWWNQMAKSPSDDPAAVLAAQFRAWLKPGWPSTYNLATGPPWFVWMLWCFNVAYVILKLASSCEWLHFPCFGLCGSSSDQRLPQSSKHQAVFCDRQMMRHAGILTGILFSVCYAARIFDKFMFGITPLAFVQRGPFMSFMPDLFPTYVIAFALGVYSGPSAWNVLARLPDSWGSWSLWVGGCWWLWAGWLLNITLRPAMVMQKGLIGWLLSWLLRTFVEQSFCVVWSIGLLVVFRQAYNVKPGMLGRLINTGAYGAYLVHPVILILFARVIMSYSFPSAVVNAAIISVPSVATSWLVAVMLRMLPGAHHVL